jgi:CxxC-x17-CxxC domain-containing protein
MAMMNKGVINMEERRESDDRFGREMHKVKCSDCGKDTEVPFKPSGDRPVYCRDCYQKHRPPRRF